MNRRGLSLLEMLLSIAIVALVSVTLARAFATGLKYQKNAGRVRAAASERARLEELMSSLIAGANLNPASAYFISPIPANQSGVQPQPQDSLLGPGSASLVLTTCAQLPPTAYMTATGQDFEALNAKYGPKCGAAEIAFSTVPVGDAGLQQGLFLREQRPPDDDPTQGGEERLLQRGLRDIRFEFYDGQSWVNAWDSKNDQKGKLPAMVRVTYVLATDPTPRTFTVRLPMSELAYSGGQS